MITRQRLTDLRDELKKEKDKPIPTLERLREILSELDHKRQHGRMGAGFEDPAKEYVRLMNNINSRISRGLRRDIEKNADIVHDEVFKTDDRRPDAEGISPWDERWYRRCFKSRYLGESVKLSYLQMMTGLTLKQIVVLQKRTNLYPVPVVSEERANKDWQERYEKGDVY